jgi:CubicO group peptidase (beta-lactamase class C family)
MTRAPDFSQVNALVEQALADRVFSAAQLAVGDGGEPRYLRAWGRTQFDDAAAGAGVAVDHASRFDVASLTKIVATMAVAMRLVEAGRLDLDAPVAAVLPELRAGAAAGADAAAEAVAGKDVLTARHLLEHSGGLHWWKPFHEQLEATRGSYADARAELVRLAAAVPLDAPPRTRCVYSDLGFILLGAACERLGGGRLDELARRLVWQPLGMEATTFVDLAAGAAPRSPRSWTAVATEDCSRRGLLVGEVHDDNAHAAGGICGHAGVFATAEDLASFAAAYARSWRGERFAGGFAPELAREFARPCPVPGSTRSLGWDRPSPGAGTSQAGDSWPRVDAVGHGGFTGTSMWLDLPRERWVVLLTNRVHPSRTEERMKVVRPRIHDAIVEALRR